MGEVYHDENVEGVRTLLENSTTVSARQNGLGLFAPSFNRITRNELKFYPDQILARHQFIEIDFQKLLHLQIGLFIYVKIIDFLLMLGLEIKHVSP